MYPPDSKNMIKTKEHCSIPSCQMKIHETTFYCEYHFFIKEGYLPRKHNSWKSALYSTPMPHHDTNQKQ